jgi:hypothetical protein
MLLPGQPSGLTQLVTSNVQACFAQRWARVLEDRTTCWITKSVKENDSPPISWRIGATIARGVPEIHDLQATHFHHHSWKITELCKDHTIPTYNNQRLGIGVTIKKRLDFWRTSHVDGQWRRTEGILGRANSKNCLKTKIVPQSPRH